MICYKPKEYQQHALDHVLENPYAGLFMEMGLGKTVVVLTAIDKLIYDDLSINKVLVIAPKKVAESVWTDEINKWHHIKHLTTSIVIGDVRKREAALKQKADIHIINRDNVAWLVSYYNGKKWPFDMVVIDESSSFKSHKAIRFKALRKIRPFVNRAVIMTGTPSPNTYLDLWPQIYLLDMGERLGQTFGGYRERYFNVSARQGFIPICYEIKKKGEYQDIDIFDKISDICISMKAEDYLDLPDKIINDVRIELPPAIRNKYEQFERDLVLEIDDENDVNAVNAVALVNKLLQMANGAVYDDDRNVHHIHDEKLDRLAEIIEDNEGKPILIFYLYKHDRERIHKRFKGVRDLKNTQDQTDWNKGNIKIMVAHPASAGHGLNLQAGGNIIVWFGCPWSLELYLQGNARLHRMGQLNPVIIHRLICKGTRDEDVIDSLYKKREGQAKLMDAVAIVKKLLKKYKNAKLVV